MDGHYAWEKLHVAVLALATGPGSLQSRLENAYLSCLIRLRGDHHFPWPDLRQRFEDLMLEVAPDRRITVALALWPEEDLRRIAQDIVGLYDRVARRIGE